MHKPPILFLTDGIGAFITAFMLFVVLRNLDDYFTMPSTILAFLSGCAALLFIYSSMCFFLLKSNYKKFIRIIIIANALYCFLTLTLLIIYYSSLKHLDIIYFVGEIIIVSLLVFVEYKTLRLISNENNNTLHY